MKQLPIYIDICKTHNEMYDSVYEPLDQRRAAHREYKHSAYNIQYQLKTSES